MLKKRKLKLIHYVILLIILAFAIWMNIRLFFINSAVCSSSSTGVCSDLLPYTIAEYLAYMSLLLLGIYAVYMYFISIGKKEVEETIVCITEFEDIDDQKEDSTITEDVKSRDFVYVAHTEINKTESTQILNNDEIDSIEEKEEIEESIIVPTTRKKRVSKPKDNTVYKKEIAANIKKSTNLSAYKAMKSLNILIDEMTQRLLVGETVAIEGLGTFTKYKVEEYKTLNPITKEEITIEEHHRIRYTPDVLFMQSIDNPTITVLAEDFADIEYAEDFEEEVIEKAQIAPIEKKKKVAKPKDNTVYKKEIAANIMKSTNLSSYKAMKSLNILIDEISESLLKGEKVSIEGLGTFKKYKVEDYTTVNPLTKEEITVEEHHRIRYKPDVTFMQNLNNSATTISNEKEKVVDKKPKVIPVQRKKKVAKPKDNSVYKKEIIANISKTTKLSRHKATQALNILVEEVSNTLLKGETVNIDGLGTFKKYRVDEYTTKNPITKEELVVETHNRIRYQPDKVFKESINKKK
jgi:DNA-binding protein HU-beta